MNRLIAALVLVAFLSAGADARTWNTKRGVIKAGEFVRVTANGVVFVAAGKRQVSIPFGEFSEPDQKHLKALFVKENIRLWTNDSGQQVLGKYLWSNKNSIFVKFGGGKWPAGTAPKPQPIEFARLSKTDKIWVRREATAKGQADQLPEAQPEDSLTAPMRTWTAQNGVVVQGQLDRLLATKKVLLAVDGSTQVVDVAHLTLGDHLYLVKVYKDSPLLASVPKLPELTVSVGGPYSIKERSSLTLAGNATGKVDPSIVEYSWDLNDDGTFGDASGASAVVSWEQLQALGVEVGDHAVKLRSSYATVTQEATGRLEVISIHPKAQAGGPYKVVEGNVLVLAGQDISPVDKSILNFGWDLNNDGTFDDAVGAAPSVDGEKLKSLGLNVGTHAVTLRVSYDDFVSEAEAVVTIAKIPAVAPTPPPRARPAPIARPPIRPGSGLQYQLKCDKCGKLAPPGATLGAPCNFCNKDTRSSAYQLGRTTGIIARYVCIISLVGFFLGWLWRMFS